MVRIIGRVAALLFLVSVGVLTFASGAAAVLARGTSSSTTTTTTQPPPHLAQASLTFTQVGMHFSDVVLVNFPDNLTPKFFLSLSPDTASIPCKPVTLSRAPSRGDMVSGYEVHCRATELPSLYAPTLEIVAGTATPTFVPVTLLNNTHSELFLWLPFLCGGGLATIVVCGARKRGGNPGSNVSVPADVAWSASDSWVTNIAAVGGVLTAVAAAASSSLGNVLPGIPIARVEILSIIFLALLALAPLLYGVRTRVVQTTMGPREVDITMSAIVDVAVRNGPREQEEFHTLVPDDQPPSTKTTGTVGGVLLASLATLIAVLGELTTVGMMVSLSTADEIISIVLYVGLAVGAGIVIWYSLCSITLLIANEHNKGPALSHLTRRGPVSAIL